MALCDLPIRVDEDKVAEFCRARGIRKLRLFGSVLREDFHPTRSDVDVLAEFHPEAVRNSGWEFFLYGEQLGEIFGYKVDLCTNLRPWLRPIVKSRPLRSTMKKHHSPRGPLLDMPEHAQRVADLTADHTKSSKNGISRSA